MVRVAILDLGLGNLQSVRRGLERAGAEALIVGASGEQGQEGRGSRTGTGTGIGIGIGTGTGNEGECRGDSISINTNTNTNVNTRTNVDVDAIVLPGVGAFRDGSSALRGFGGYIEEVKSGKPLLGLCLGMQLLFTKGFEGGEFPGLGLIKGDVVKMTGAVRIPHMGWNSIQLVKESPITAELKDGDFFYFVHSYFCRPQEDATVAYTEYGTRIPAIVQKANIFGTQFHPEKSSRTGGIVLRNFVEAVKR